MENLQNDSSLENKKKPFYVQYFISKIIAIYEIIWKNMVQPNRTQMNIWGMHIARWIPKTTNTHSEYVILLFHYNNGSTSAPHCSVIRTLLVLFKNVLK